MTSPLHICHVLASYKEIGGLEKNVIDITTRQAELGHKVTVLTTEKYLDQFAEGVKTVDVKLQRSRSDFRLKWQLKKVIKGLSPDIVHAHANKPSQIIGKLSLSCKKVATVHNIKKNQSVFNPFDSVIAVSNPVANSLQRGAHIIWNSVENLNSKNKALALDLNPPFLDSGRPIFFAAARFVEAKGFDLLLEAFAKTKNCSLWLIGEGRDEELLKGIITKHNLSDRVWMPGFLRPDEVLGLMQLADCFVISSRNEGGPYTLAEALKAQCPVISTKVGYVPDFLTEDQLADDISAGSIYQKLDKFLQNPSEFRLAMAPIFDTASRDLDLNNMVDKVVEVYRQTLES